MSNIRYYFTRRDGKWGYWIPCLKRGGKPTLMAKLGFSIVDCGRDGPDAHKIAVIWNQRWDEARARYERGEVEGRPVFLAGSFADAFARFRHTQSWAEKKPRTREDWERGWKRIEPIFGDLAPATVSFEFIDGWYWRMVDKHGVREAHRALKIWRALWQQIATLQDDRGNWFCEQSRDPSAGIRRRTPVARNAMWFEGEAVRLTKRAWRMGYKGLAAALAVSWDTMLSPVDVRTLSLAQLRGDAVGQMFAVARAKTGRAAIGTLGRRANRVLAAYIASLPFTLLPATPIFHTRGFDPAAAGGRPRRPVPYTKDTLGDDFRIVRAAEFPGDKRTLMDFRRSGAIEAKAGAVDPAALADKMANSIDSNRQLQSTYLPLNVTNVRDADAARARGRSRLRGIGKAPA